jgi:quercetin dioxygenase-like cupin family protein
MTTIQTSEVLQFTALIDYQSGAIVSRQITHSKEGNITLFSFDEGQGLSEHAAPFDALVQILDGEAEITISGKAFIVKKDDAILMPANELHAIKALHRFKMLLTMLQH